MSLEQLWGLGGLLSKLMQLCDICIVKDPVFVKGTYTLC